MPLHFDAITNNSRDSSLLTYLLTNGLDHADGAVASEDGRILHIANYMRDVGSGDRIGKFVFTLLRDEAAKSLQILDVDITLDSKDTVALRFLKKLPGSSDANEYYDVETAAEEQHLQIETVNRNCIKDYDLTDTVRDVRACAFPFRLTLFDDIDALNAFYGFTEKSAGYGDMKIGGLSETFAAPGNIVQNKDYEGETFSLLVGTIRSYRDVSVNFGERTLLFTIAQVETALGLLPTAMSREVFDLSSLAPGRVISMYADVKADFAVDQ